MGGTAKLPPTAALLGSTTRRAEMTPRRLTKAALVAGAAMALAAPAYAQAQAQAQAPAQQTPAGKAAPTTPAPTASAKPGPKPGEKQVEGVTVTAASPDAFRSSIDRRSYSLGRDLQATTGSIAD